MRGGVVVRSLILSVNKKVLGLLQLLSINTMLLQWGWLSNASNKCIHGLHVHLF